MPRSLCTETDGECGVSTWGRILTPRSASPARHALGAAHVEIDTARRGDSAHAGLSAWIRQEVQVHWRPRLGQASGGAAAVASEAPRAEGACVDVVGATVGTNVGATDGATVGAESHMLH